MLLVFFSFPCNQSLVLFFLFRDVAGVRNFQFVNGWFMKMGNEELFFPLFKKFILISFGKFFEIFSRYIDQNNGNFDSLFKQPNSFSGICILVHLLKHKRSNTCTGNLRVPFQFNLFTAVRKQVAFKSIG